MSSVNRKRSSFNNKKFTTGSKSSRVQHEQDSFSNSKFCLLYHFTDYPWHCSLSIISVFQQKAENHENPEKLQMTSCHFRVGSLKTQHHPSPNQPVVCCRRLAAFPTARPALLASARASRSQGTSSNSSGGDVLNRDSKWRI